MAEDAKAPAKPRAKAKKEKPPAVEDKPFPTFMSEHFIPALQSALESEGISDIQLTFAQSPLPALAGATPSDQCWQIVGNWTAKQRQFNLYFFEESIKGAKAFSYSVNGQPPSTLESFMIDERKVTLPLMVLYTIQRLNSQKWLTGN